MQNLCALWRIERVRTTAYHPGGKGAYERLNQTTKRGFQRVLHCEHLDQWDVAYSEVMFSYNATVHSGTGFTPQFLMFGEESRVPSEVIVGIPTLQQTASAYSFRRYQRLSLAYNSTGEATACAQRRAKH